MKLDSINISEIAEKTKTQLKEDTSITPSLKRSLELILMVVVMLAERLGLHSKNSSIPPSKDPNRKKNQKQKVMNLLAVKKGIKVLP